MASALPSPTECCTNCTTPVDVNVPGPQGPACTPCTDGTDGISAFTTLTAPFTVPAELASDTAEVADSRAFTATQVVYLQGAGWFEVSSITDDTHIVLTNLENSTTGAYADNVPPGTVIAAGSKLTQSGPQGPTGATGTGTAPVDATYITQTPNATLTQEQALSALTTGLMKSTTGTGVVSIVTLGIAANNVSPVDAGGALVAGQSVFAVAGGLQSKTAANARTALGIALGILNTNIPPVDQAPGFTVGQMVRATAAGLESISNATLLAQLGIGSLPGALLIYQNQQTSGTNGGSVNAGGNWELVPLNTEVVDTGANGSINAGTSVISLAAGTYRAQWRCPACIGGKFQSRLYNIDAGSVIAYGTSVVSAATTSMLESGGECRFTLVTTPTQIQLQIRASVANLLTGFGEACGFGNTEIYQALILVKET